MKSNQRTLSKLVTNWFKLVFLVLVIFSTQAPGQTDENRIIEQVFNDLKTKIFVADAQSQSNIVDLSGAIQEIKDKLLNLKLNAFVSETTKDVLVVGKDYHLEQGKTIENLAVFWGNVTIDGEVNRDVIVVNGKVDVSGKVYGTLLCIGGDVTLLPGCQVEKYSVINGKCYELNKGRFFNRFFHGHENSTFFDEMRFWHRSSLFPIFAIIGIKLVLSLLFLLLLLGFLLVFSDAAQKCKRTIIKKGILAFLIGLIVLVLLVPLLVFLILTIIGILFIPFVALAIFVLFIFGQVGLCVAIGEGIAKLTGLKLFQKSFIQLISGFIILSFVLAIPFFGFAIWMLTLPLSLGTPLIALFSKDSENENGIACNEKKVPPQDFTPNRFSPQPPPVTGTVAHPQETSTPPTSTTESNINKTADSNEPPSAQPAAQPCMAEQPVSPKPPTITMQQAKEPSATPANNVLETAYARAGFWIRLAATILDFIIITMIVGFLQLWPIWLLVWVGYHVAMWSWKNTTIGGIILKIKIIRLDATPINFSVALVRALVALISAFPMFLGFIWCSWDEEKQSWHDKVVGTTIVRVPSSVRLI